MSNQDFRLIRSRAGDQALVIVSIGVLCAVAFACWRLLAAQGAEVILRELGAAAPLVSVPVHIVLSATPFPSELVGVANGAVYGFWAGTAYSWLGWWLGSLIEFGMVRRGARAFVHPEQAEHVPSWLRRFPAAHPVFLIVGRQLPFGFHLVNLSAGIAGISVSRFVICSAVANVPYALLTTAAGAGLTN